MPQVDIKKLLDNNDLGGITEFLIQYRRDPKTINQLFDCNGTQETILTYAMQRYDAMVINLILSSPAIDVTVENSNGLTIMSLLATLDIASFLHVINHEKIKDHLTYISSKTGNNIVHDIILTIMDRKSLIAFKIALIKEMLAALISIPIDINAPNKQGEIPINIIFNRFHTTDNRESSFRVMCDLLRTIAKFPGFNPNVFDPATGMTPLMIAAIHSASLTSTLCHIPNINVNAKDIGDSTALHFAMASHSTRTVTHLTCVHDCILDSRNNDHDTPLMISVKKNALTEFKYLLKLLIQNGIHLSHIIEDDYFQHLIQHRSSPKILDVIAEISKQTTPPVRRTRGGGATSVTYVAKTVRDSQAARALDLLASAAEIRATQPEIEAIPVPMDVAPARNVDKIVHAEPAALEAASSVDTLDTQIDNASPVAALSNERKYQYSKAFSILASPPSNCKTAWLI